MLDDRWRLVDEIFDAALEVQGAAREALLDQACGEDGDLRVAVKRLLVLEAESGDFLSLPAASCDFTRDLEATEAELAGARIGPYRLERLLGRGGMGQVFLAERDDDQFEKQVAIKVLSGPGTPALLRRFRTERQILARFEHPSIARLVDGGVTDFGQLYLVLEYVEGEPIDLYCWRGNLSLQQRLRLFLEVCSALSYAHQQLIVHRDLKPANLLVTADGTPKLLDFGIAKVLDPGHFPHEPANTQLGLRPLTLQYASPEQVSGGVISTATDVYGLGLLLFELLTGRPPLSIDGLSAAAAERRICEQDPPAASAVLAARGAAPVGLPIRPHQLKGDLDKILTKALAKEPERRYSSVRHLAEDLERHLDQRPVLARTGGFVYHTTRFVRRRALAVAAVSTLFLLLLGFLLTQQEHAKQLARERDEAQVARQRAEYVSRYLVKVFKDASPESSRGHPPTARDLLERGAGAVLTQLDEDPALQTTLMVTMAEAYSGLGLHRQAIDLLETARHRLQRLYGATDPKVAEASVLLGPLSVWVDDPVRADAYLREALAIRTRALGERDPLTLASLVELADLRLHQGRFEEARQLYDRALALQREVLGPTHLETVRTEMNLAGVWLKTGKNQKAAEVLEAALPSLRQALGADHPDVATALHDLGSTLEAVGDFLRAEEYLSEALELRHGLYSADDPRTAKTLSNLVLVYTELGDDRAVPLARQALAQRRQRLGEEHPQIAHGMAILGEALYRSGRVDEALVTYRESIAHIEKAWPSGHPNLAYPVSRLGGILFEIGRVEEAEGYLRRAVEIRQQVMTEDDPLLVKTEADLEKCLLRLGKTDK